MFYVTKTKKKTDLGEKYGVMDTKDGVMEFYTEDEIWAIRQQGIKVISQVEMITVCAFLRHTMLNMEEFAGSEFDLLTSYVEGGTKDSWWGGSHLDYAQSFKKDYIQAKKLGYDGDLFECRFAKDLFCIDYYNMYNRYSNDKSVLEDFANKWKLTKDATAKLVY